MKKIKLLYLTLLSWISVSGIAYASAAIDEIVKKASGDKISSLAETELSFSGTTIWVLIATLFICLNLTNLAFEVAQHFGGASSGPVGNSIYSSVSAVAGGTMIAAGKSIESGYGLYKESKRAKKAQGSATSASSKSAGANSYEGPGAAASTPAGQSDTPSGGSEPATTQQPSGNQSGGSQASPAEQNPQPTTPPVEQPPAPQEENPQIQRYFSSDSTGSSVLRKTSAGDFDAPAAPAKSSAAAGVALLALAYGKKAIGGAERALGSVAKLFAREGRPKVDKNGIPKRPLNERNIKNPDSDISHKGTTPNKRNDQDLEAAKKIGGYSHSLEGYRHSPEGREEKEGFFSRFQRKK